MNLIIKNSAPFVASTKVVNPDLPRKLERDASIVLVNIDNQPDGLTSNELRRFSDEINMVI